MLRSFQPTDAEDLHAYLSDPRVYQFEPGEPINLEQAHQMASELANSTDFWAVELRETNQVIGQIYLHKTDPPHLQTWELGYILSPNYQQNGYMSEAVRALIWHCFNQKEVHRMVAHCNPANLASWKLLEKVGFRREGLLRQDVYFRKNAQGQPIWTDTFVYALLKTDLQE
jgi:RimJ/RimL family protein N-acetyltransferase